MDPFIVGAAPTGARRRTDDRPAPPITADAIARTAAAALEGHARVGFETSRQTPDGRTARDTGDVVATAAAIAPFSGRALAEGAAERTPVGVTGA